MLRLIASLATGVVVFAPLPAIEAMAQEAAISGRTAVPALDALKRTVTIPDFRIGGTYDLADRAAWEQGGAGGVTLESLGAGPLETSYIAVGTPRTGADGRIDNAIVISSFYSGDASSMYFNWFEGEGGNAFSGGPLVGPGRMFDTDRFYVIFVDALGLWGASKPSDGLGLQFPNYTYYDMVQANYRLLTDHLNVGHVVLATGVSMGATQSYMWGLMHPDFVDAVLPVGGATATDGGAPIAAWTFQLAKAALESDPVWRETGGDYYHLPKEEHPLQGPAFHWSMLSLTGYDLAHRQSLGWEATKGSVFAWDPPEEGFGDAVAGLGGMFDAVDLKYRVEVGETHNINGLLDGYEPRTLIVHIENDNWLTVDRARESAELIQGAEIVTESSPIAHYATFSSLNRLADHPVVESFLSETGITDEPGKVCDAPGYTSPSVNMNPDPQTSFWFDNMVSPFPVQFAKASDGRGVEWEIGYMDVVCEGIENPETLVIVHGKGAFGAHYGYLIRHAVEQGLRVIVPDMPHYGMSGPGNLDKSFARTFTDMREVTHELVVNQLGVEDAYYLGHSMGGQFVMGYALDYPEAVAGVILMGTAGLEEYPESIDFGTGPLYLFDTAMGHDFALWEETWAPLNLVENERNRSEQWVRDFFHFVARDPETGATSPSPFGYFKNDTEFAQLHTNQRIAMITGNPAEFEQWITLFHYDTFTMASENVAGNPDNLYNRLPQIEAPIFLAYGADEPFIPTTAFNGLDDMANDAILPFLRRMSAAGRDVETKLYPGVAHFIHTDVPVEFARDTVDFIRTGRVDAMSAAVIDTLVNGPSVAGGGSSGGDRPAGFSK